MAEQYGVPVILHTDHCAKSLLPWVDGMLDESEEYYKVQHAILPLTPTLVLVLPLILPVKSLQGDESDEP